MQKGDNDTNRKSGFLKPLIYLSACFFAGILFLISLSPSSSGKTPGEPPALSNAIVDTSLYPWMHEEFNMIQFYSRDALEHFYKVWMQTKERKLSIVHLGDSHLQSDAFPGQARKSLQAIHGDGGRGMMFPYSTAKSYSSIEYKTTHTGDWTFGKSYIVPSKIPLGVVGMTCNTVKADAGFTFTFKEPVPATHTQLKLFIKKQHDSFDCTVEAGGKIILVEVDSSSADTLPYYQIDIPPVGKEIVVRMAKNNSWESEFEFYGMSLETPANNGLIFHNCGVGASRYQSILYEELFQAQLPSLNPDLVIIDFGTNDYLYDDSIKTNLETEITQVIGRVRAVAPNASIVLTSTMDMYRKGGHVTSGEKFSGLIHQVARKENCGVFDWYWIAGGWKVMQKWQDSAIAQPDMIHLTLKGYRLKGKLLVDAMVKTTDWMSKNPEKDSLVLFTDSIRAQQKRFRLADTTEAKAAIAGKVLVKHKVKPGESLSSIGKKYGVTVADIKKWNKLRSNMIHPNQVLLIYKKKR